MTVLSITTVVTAGFLDFDDVVEGLGGQSEPRISEIRSLSTLPPSLLVVVDWCLVVEASGVVVDPALVIVELVNSRLTTRGK